MKPGEHLGTRVSRTKVRLTQGNTREHTNSIPGHTAGVAPCLTATGKVPGMSSKELTARKA